MGTSIYEGGEGGRGLLWQLPGSFRSLRRGPGRGDWGAWQAAPTLSLWKCPGPVLSPRTLMHPCMWVGDAPDTHGVLSCLSRVRAGTQSQVHPNRALATHLRGSADSWAGSCSAGVSEPFHRVAAQSVRRPDVCSSAGPNANPPKEASPGSRNRRGQRPSSPPSSHR